MCITLNSRRHAFAFKIMSHLITDFLIFSKKREISGVIESPGEIIGSIIGLFMTSLLRSFVNNFRDLMLLNFNWKLQSPFQSEDHILEPFSDFITKFVAWMAKN